MKAQLKGRIRNQPHAKIPNVKINANYFIHSCNHVLVQHNMHMYLISSYEGMSCRFKNIISKEICHRKDCFQDVRYSGKLGKGCCIYIPHNIIFGTHVCSSVCGTYY